MKNVKGDFFAGPPPDSKRYSRRRRRKHFARIDAKRKKNEHQEIDKMIEDVFSERKRT